MTGPGRRRQVPRRARADEILTLACSVDRLYPEHWAGPNKPGCKGWVVRGPGRIDACTCACHNGGDRGPKPDDMPSIRGLRYKR